MAGDDKLKGDLRQHIFKINRTIGTLTSKT